MNDVKNEEQEMKIVVELDLIQPWFDAFVREGLFGKTPEETAAGLIQQGIRDQMRHAEIRSIDGVDVISRWTPKT